MDFYAKSALVTGAMHPAEPTRDSFNPALWVEIERKGDPGFQQFRVSVNRFVFLYVPIFVLIIRHF